jgi:hypothetical protein
VATPPTANEIKTQLKTLLTPVIATSSTKKAKILDYLPLAFLVAEGEDTTVLESPLDAMTLTNSIKHRVNCLLISSIGFGQAPPQRDSTRLITTPSGKNIITRRFAVIYLYEFSENSENVFETNVELIRTTLNESPKLGFATMTAGVAGQGEFIQDHDGWQVPSSMPQPFTGTIAHVADGVLTVRVIDPLGNQ